MQFRAQKCPQEVIPHAKVPFSLKQHRALFQSWAEHCVLQAEIGKEPPCVMLFTDDLVMCEHSRVEVALQLERWRETFESHGLRVSRGKTE